jgi:multidrug efflux pump
MINIAKLSIEKSRSVLFLLAMIIFYGTISYLDIAKEDKPDVQIPFVYVTTFLKGVSPEDAERLIAKPLEKNLKNLDNVKQISTYCFNGGASAFIEFNAGFDIKTALQDVRDNVSTAKAEFPKETKEPEIHEINLSKFPVLSIAISSNMDERSLNLLVNDLKNKIAQVKNVLKVELDGNRDEVTEVIIEPHKLYSYKINLEQALGFINSNNNLITAGTLNNSHGSYTIKIPSVIEKYDDLLSIPIQRKKDHVTLLKEIVDINHTLVEPETLVRMNGKKAIVLKISKKIGSNIIKTIEDVKEAVAQETAALNTSLEVTYALDTSEDIKENLKNLENNIILSVILSLLPILLSLGVRSAFLVALAVPVSFVMGILVLKALGYSLNIVVIFSLILSIGMLVDASIVICEYADRMKCLGHSSKDAYITATKKMWWPVFSATVSALLVFVPLFFWPGIIGQFMKYMPITVIVTVTASLIVAYIFVPTIGCILSKNEVFSETDKINMLSAETVDVENLQGSIKKYVLALQTILKTPIKFIALIIAALIAIIFLYGAIGPGVEFFPNIEPNQGIISIYAKGNLSLTQKDNIAKKTEAILNNYRSEIKSYSTSVKEYSSQKEDLMAEVLFELSPWDTRRKAVVILEELNQKFARIPGVRIIASAKKEGPGEGSPVKIEVSGSDEQILIKDTKKILEIVNKTIGIKDIDSDLDVNKIEWKLNINKEKAAKFGINSSTISAFVEMATSGYKITNYRPSYTEKEVDIILRLPLKYRTLSYLDNLYVNGEFGPMHVSHFITRELILKTPTIHRVNGYRTFTINADLKDGYLLENILKSLSHEFKQKQFDKSVNIKFAGEKEDQEETSAFLKMAFLLALIAMFIIMLFQFNSFYHAFIVMSAVFLSTAGVFLGLLIAYQPFGIVMCGLGIIALAGTVVNNNIIFLDTYADLRKEGLDTYKAIIATSAQRARPIMLTAFTSVVGLLPTAMGLDINFFALEFSINSPSSQWWTQISTTIIGGLAFATILTLFFTPCLLIIEDKFKNSFYKFLNLSFLIKKLTLLKGNLYFPKWYSR